MKRNFFISPHCHPFCAICIVAVILVFGVLAGSAQPGHYLYTGTNQTITFSPGTYNITAYGAQGGWNNYDYSQGGLGAEMECQFHFSTSTTLTLLVGGVGSAQGAGGGGGTFIVNGSMPLVIAGGGGGAGYYLNGNPGLTGTSGGDGVGNYGSGGNNGNGGSGGQGGDNTYNSGGGGGFFSNGGISPNGGYNAGGGFSFLNGGGGGGGGLTAGGFGGGGGGLIAVGGGGGGYSGGGGASQYGSGGGGGSYIDSSAIAMITEIFGVASPNDSEGNGEIIITTGPGPFLTNFLVSPTELTVAIGASEAFAATGYFSDGSVSDLAVTNGLVWSSSRQEVATINSNGVATALTSGTTTITATEDGLSRNVALTILSTATGGHIFLFAGTRQTLTLAPGVYDITAYGAQGGKGVGQTPSGLGAEMKGEFSFTTPTTLILLVGGVGASVIDGGNGGGGGGGGSFVVNGTTVLVAAGGGGGSSTSGGSGGNADTDAHSNSGSGGLGGDGGGGGGASSDGGSGYNGLGGASFLNGGIGGGGGGFGGSGGFGGGGGGGFIAGGGGGGFDGGDGGNSYNGDAGGGAGGGSYIDSSALADLTELSGIVSPDDPTNGEIIITPVITMTSPSMVSGNFQFGMTGPVNVPIVVQTCTNLANPAWIPLTTNTLNNGTNYFTDAQWTNYPCRFYRVSTP